MAAEQRFRRAVFAACALHVLLLVGVSRHRRHVNGPSSRANSAPMIHIELALRESSDPPLIESPANQEHPQRETRLQRRTGVQQRIAHSKTSADPGATGATAGAAETEASAQNLSVSPSGTAAPTPGEAERNGGRTSLRPRHSGLGDDFGLAYALSQQEKPSSTAERATDNLRRSMQQEQADHERKLGLNVPAPLIIALEGAAREVAIPTNSVAVFTANIDGAGHLLGLEFTGSNHASPQWNKLTARVEQLLRGRKLAIARNVKGVDLRLRLVARAQLPSGADPGLGVDVLGLPIKKGQGKRSSKVTLLDPTPKMLEVDLPGTNGEEKVKIPLPTVVLSILSVAGDPSDIGAPVRHMVRVEVLEEKIY